MLLLHQHTVFELHKHTTYTLQTDQALPGDRLCAAGGGGGRDGGADRRLKRVVVRQWMMSERQQGDGSSRRWMTESVVRLNEKCQDSTASVGTSRCEHDVQVAVQLG